MNDDKHAEGAVLMVSTIDILASNLFYSRWLQSSTNLFTNRNRTLWTFNSFLPGVLKRVLALASYQTHDI